MCRVVQADSDEGARVDRGQEFHGAKRFGWARGLGGSATHDVQSAVGCQRHDIVPGHQAGSWARGPTIRAKAHWALFYPLATGAPVLGSSHTKQRGTILTRLDDAPGAGPPPARQRYTDAARSAANPLIRALVRAGVGPNAITVVGFVGAVATSVLVVAQYWIAAGMVFLISALSDMLDGSVARISGRATRFGAFLDSTLDRLGEAFVLGAIGVSLATDGSAWAVGMVFAALAGSFLVSYTRARAEGLGIDSNRGGIMSRPERLVVVGLGIFLGGVGPMLEIMVTILAVLTLVTVAQRLSHVHSTLRAADGGPGNSHRGGDPTS